MTCSGLQHPVLVHAGEQFAPVFGEGAGSVHQDCGDPAWRTRNATSATARADQIRTGPVPGSRSPVILSSPRSDTRKTTTRPPRPQGGAAAGAPVRALLIRTGGPVSSAARYSWIIRIAVAPSPTAEATRLIDR